MLVSFAINSAALAALFRFLTGTHLAWRVLWPGSLLGGAAITVLQLGAGLLLGYTPSDALLATFAIFIGLLVWFRLNGIVMLVASAWIAVRASDEKIPLLEKTEAERVRASTPRSARRARAAADGAGGAGARPVVPPVAGRSLGAAGRAGAARSRGLRSRTARHPRTLATRDCPRPEVGANRLVLVPRRLRIASVNVNGIRAAARKGMLPWLEQADVDVLALQEVRATAEELATSLPGWQTVNDEALAKGRRVSRSLAHRFRRGPAGTRGR